MTRVPERGFTLVEIMVVMVVIGVLVGLVGLATGASRERLLDADAQKLALILSAAREEAQVRSRPVRWEASKMGYAFLERGPDGWYPLTKDDLLRPRAWKAELNAVVVQAADGSNLVEFGREAIDRPFVIELTGQAESTAPGVRIQIRADGLGAFDVVRP